ncbi:YigZ family protein [Liquorilactobacillus cacaonum]|uniref:YigZ family protein n=1 Tax=Liquorilactobacillus cacaonum DSM 21116 TaxID=1423729 RepID=A0A0R2CFJ3_9LACO|nr:YigZ family protein [Liquorilactobacillus cacaonum]KRM90424.1 hypothetical protein FC80_GL001328 [Liquorilactobacillus cacaonum DSM 21116]
MVIKKSIFICSVARTETEQEAQQFIKDITNQNAKARHNCFAYVIGDNNDIQRQSDNGEPSGTAGVPILEVLLKKDIHNVTAVVTRYFGGIKLGTGGLIRAYGQSTSLALEKNIVLKLPKNITKVTIAYSQLNKLQNFSTTNNLSLDQISYQENVTVLIATKISETHYYLEKIKDLLNGQVEFDSLGINYIEVSPDEQST